MSLILTRQAALDLFARGTWQREHFDDFATRMTSDTQPFPCVYGVSGFKADHLRFAFIEATPAKQLGAALLSYLAIAPNLGANTSLVVFFPPSFRAETIETYRTLFWSLLDDLAAMDPHPWPNEIPRRLDHADWEFCFAGQPMFVVCNTPAHIARKSRAAAGFMLTFQPRYVFNGLLGTPEAARRATAAVRARLVPYDAVSVSPVLGLYGDPANREYAQYFLDETNTQPLRCPFNALGEARQRVAVRPHTTQTKEEMDA